MATNQTFGTNSGGGVNQGISMSVEYDPKNLLGPGAVTRRYLRLMNSFPPNMWNPIKDKIEKVQAQQAREIKGHSVSKGTMKWRKWQIKKGIKVETYRGTFRGVNSGSRMGDRTGTLLDALRNSSEPGVSLWEGTPWGGVRRGYGEPIKNGAFSSTIENEAFAEVRGWGGYPAIFQNYLVKTGILPSGFLGFVNESPFLDWSLEHMNRTVKRHFIKQFGENPWG